MNNSKFFSDYKEAYAFYESQKGEASIGSSKKLGGWIVQYTEVQKDTEYPITVRGNGKYHPAIMHSRYGIMITCSCPGSQNGWTVHNKHKTHKTKPLYWGFSMPAIRFIASPVLPYALQ